MQSTGLPPSRTNDYCMSMMSWESTKPASAGSQCSQNENECNLSPQMERDCFQKHSNAQRTNGEPSASTSENSTMAMHVTVRLDDDYYALQSKESVLFVESDSDCIRPFYGIGHWKAPRMVALLLACVTVANVFLFIVDEQRSGIPLSAYADLSTPESLFGLGPDWTLSAGIPQVGENGTITAPLSPSLLVTEPVDTTDSQDDNLFAALSMHLKRLVKTVFNDDAEDATLAHPSDFDSPSNEEMAQNVDPNWQTNHILAISSKIPFLAPDDIAELTLDELGTIFEYAIESSKDSFSRGKFVRGLLPRVKYVIDTMDEAVAKSRGNGVKDARTGFHGEIPGDYDSLKFCAAMRIFADWRLVRTIPDGFKGYAFGMKLGQKDIVQNVAKLEQATHDWIDQMGRRSNEPKTPTLRDLLLYEINRGVHKSLPVLQENTAAMGLLWTRRQLEYQLGVFENLLTFDRFSSSLEGITEAYMRVYRDFHGWTVQKIFTYSFQAAPEVNLVFNHMNPHRLQELYNMSPSGKVLIPEEASSRESAEATKPNVLQKLGSEVENVLSSIFQDKSLEEMELAVKDHEDSDEDTIETMDWEQFIGDEMKKDAEEKIVEFLKVSEPLAANLSILFKECNMNDPTVV